MKNLIRSIVLILATSSILLSAPNPKGTIIRETDTMHVTFIIPVIGPNYSMLQEGVRYYDSLNNECRINPRDAKEFRFEYKGELVRMVSHSYDSDSTRKIFLRLLIDGPIKLFNYYSTVAYTGTTTHSLGTGNKSKNYQLQKGTGDLVIYDNMNIKNDIPFFFENCPELVKMIQYKAYLKSDVEKIVTYYNINCGWQDRN